MSAILFRVRCVNNYMLRSCRALGANLVRGSYLQRLYGTHVSDNGGYIFIRHTVAMPTDLWWELSVAIEMQRGWKIQWGEIFAKQNYAYKLIYHLMPPTSLSSFVPHLHQAKKYHHHHHHHHHHYHHRHRHHYHHNHQYQHCHHYHQRRRRHHNRRRHRIIIIITIILVVVVIIFFCYCYFSIVKLFFLPPVHPPFHLCDSMSLLYDQ